MSSAVIAFLTFAVFLTSMLSGVFGMMGGMVLMVILLALMPVSAAMAVHAAVQLVSNGWRCLSGANISSGTCFLVYRGYRLRLMLLALLRYVPTKFRAHPDGMRAAASLLAHRYLRLSIENRVYRPLGTVLTFIHLTAGVVGPLLDLLYVNAPLTRRQIIDQGLYTIGDASSGWYYGALVALVTGQGGWPEDVGTLWMFILCAASVAGTSTAALIVRRMSDAHFKAISRVLIALISLYCLYQGITGKLGL